jgi:hypothetical protein
MAPPSDDNDALELQERGQVASDAPDAAASSEAAEAEVAEDVVRRVLPMMQAKLLGAAAVLMVVAASLGRWYEVADVRRGVYGTAGPFGLDTLQNGGGPLPERYLDVPLFQCPSEVDALGSGACGRLMLAHAGVFLYGAALWSVTLLMVAAHVLRNHDAAHRRMPAEARERLASRAVFAGTVLAWAALGFSVLMLSGWFTFVQDDLGDGQIAGWPFIALLLSLVLTAMSRTKTCRGRGGPPDPEARPFPVWIMGGF